MIFESPYPNLTLPPSEETILPHFLLEPSTHTNARAQEAILYPPPPGSAFVGRPEVKPLSLDDVTNLAYRVARGLKEGKLGGKPFVKGEVVALYSPNQVSCSLSCVDVDLIKYYSMTMFHIYWAYSLQVALLPCVIRHTRQKNWHISCVWQMFARC